MEPGSAQRSPAPVVGTGEEDATRSLGRAILRAGRNAAGIAALVAAFAVAALMLVPALLGLNHYVITGASMTGTYDRGSLVFEEVVPTSELKVGDVITYTPPGEAGGQALVTHRIVLIREKRGERMLRTKGDANASPDPWHFTLVRPTQSRVVFHVPYVGYVFSALAIREVRVLAIGLPALLIAVAVLLGLWRWAGEEARRLSDREPAAARSTGSLEITPHTGLEGPVPPTPAATPAARSPEPAQHYELGRLLAGASKREQRLQEALEQIAQADRRVREAEARTVASFREVQRLVVGPLGVRAG